MQKTVLFTLALLLNSVGYAATCNPNIAKTAPDSRYQVLGNGSEIKDLKTNLIWQRCSLGQSWLTNSCAGSVNSYTWQDALVAASLQKANGWRLPNIKELQTLVEESCQEPAINQAMFPSVVADVYYSSSPVASALVGATITPWILQFKQGMAFFNPDLLAHVLLVRE